MGPIGPMRSIGPIGKTKTPPSVSILLIRRQLRRFPVVNAQPSLRHEQRQRRKGGGEGRPFLTAGSRPAPHRPRTVLVLPRNHILLRSRDVTCRLFAIFLVVLVFL